MELNTRRALLLFISTLSVVLPATAAAPERSGSVVTHKEYTRLASRSEVEMERKKLSVVSPCEEFFSLYERRFELPRGLLRAVSTHESGRRLTSKGPSVAWPWTVNVEGKGHYFPDKQQALTFLSRAAPKMGSRSVDVGCMQVNVKYHPDAFSSYAEGLDPETNVRYGAAFLRARYEATSDWLTAVADYHSKLDEEGRQYAERVLRLWKRQQPDLSAAMIARYEKRNEGLPAAFLETAPEPLAQAGAAALDSFRRFYLD